MFTKRKIIGMAGMLTLIGLASVVGTAPSGAATPQCGASCIGVFSYKFGTTSSPNFVETVRDGIAVAGQPTELSPASGTNPAEDLMVPRAGPVSSFHAQGLVSDEINQDFANETAIQLEYTPLGVRSGLCAALADTAYQNEGLTLQPCSVGARAVWVVDTQDSSVPGFFAIVNGSSTDLSRPFAMIYYQNPAHRAAQIRVAHLRYSGPPNQMPRTLPDEQLWGKAPGPLS